MKIILASKSPRRYKLLKQIGFKFKVITSNVDEKIFAKEIPSNAVKRISLLKANDVANKVKKGIIIGADTIVVLNNKILGKPKSKTEAIKMLQMLSNKTHTVYTGIALVNANSNKNISISVKTKVKFRKLNKTEICKYVQTGSPMDKAGAYGIQDDYGAVFVEKINGCYYNVVGFPLAKFLITYNKFISK